MNALPRFLRIALAVHLGLMVVDVQARGRRAQDRADTASVMHRKLQKIVIPRIRFEDVPVSTAVEILRELARENDPEGKGVNIVFLQSAEMRDTVLNAELRGVPVNDVLRFMSTGTDLSVRVDDDAVVISGRKAPQNGMTTRTYSVAARLFDADSGRDDESVRNFLDGKGVRFPPDSSITYHRGLGKLVMHNTEDNQRRLKRLLDELQQ